MPNFDGKVVIITGASSGIGATTALEFAKKGAKLVLCGRNLENLHKTSEKCVTVGNGVRPIILKCDVMDEYFDREIVETAIDRFGQIDILVNNVGIGTSDNIETMDLNKFDEIMNTNLRATIKLTKSVIPYLKKTKGNIVNVSSVAGKRSFSRAITYCISKAALDQFTKCSSLHLASKNVRVNSVNPGVISTDFYIRSGMSKDVCDKYMENCKETHAMGRIGHTDEVASAILYLASEEASFITGSLLSVDGGKHVMCP